MSADIEKGLVKTVIVKDLSRFGRNYIEVGSYSKIIYPEAGVRFIAIMDNVDTGSLESNEFAAFTNLFNEWYPKSTSKKVKEVKKAKGLAGEHLGAPPYGYLRNPDDKTRWLVDGEAAAVVRRIFSLCMQGKGVSAIATTLWKDRTLTPSAYKASKGIGVAKVSEDPYCWETSAVAAILENVAYIGITESFKSTRLGFKSKKRIPTAKDRRAYIENAHAPIIDRDIWEKVQIIRENKRRPNKSGITSMFSGLLYCADCGAKLSLANASNAGVSWYADLKGYIGVQPTKLYGSGTFKLAPKSTTTSGSTTLYGHYVHPKAELGLSVNVSSYGSFSISGGSNYDERGSQKTISW